MAVRCLFLLCLFLTVTGAIITTIAIRGRILAADTQLTWDDNIKSLCRKISPLPGSGGGAISVAGNCADEIAFMAWWNAGEKMETWDSARMKKASFEAIYVDKWKDVYFYSDGPEKMKMEHEFHAIGSGGKVAIAGMHLGMTAKEAVLFASELDISTNNLVDCYDIQTGKLTLCKWPQQRKRFQYEASSA